MNATRKLAILLAFIVCCAPAALHAVTFVDVGATKGLTETDTTFGASWGDINGDKWAPITNE